MGTHEGIDALLADITLHAGPTKDVGDWVERAADVAMSLSPIYGARFARSETWARWATRFELPDGLRHDIGVDRVITTPQGSHWLVQTKGHDAAALESESTRVGLSVLSQLHALKVLVPVCEKLIVVTTGSGLGRTAQAMNDAARLGVVCHDREWLRNVDGIPETVAGLDEHHRQLMARLRTNRGA